MIGGIPLVSASSTQKENKMNGYKIDKDKPIPRGRKNCEWSFVIDMKSGESFYMETGGIRGNLSKLNALRVWGRRNKIKITTRAEGTGYRVWVLE